MYNGERILAIIPARKGSKRIKNKNSVLLAGKPMFEYSIDVANESKYIDDVLFTTDSKEWLERAVELGCLNIDVRCDELSTDTARTIDVILYEINRNNLKEKYTTVILLQPTSPYRTADLIDKAIEKFFKTKESLISVVKCNENPIFMRKIQNGRLIKYTNETSQIRSQDLEQLYRIVGNIYINSIDDLTKTTVLNENVIPYIIDSKFDLDIDTEDDLKNAAKILKENSK